MTSKIVASRGNGPAGPGIWTKDSSFLPSRRQISKMSEKEWHLFLQGAWNSASISWSWRSKTVKEEWKKTVPEKGKEGSGALIPLSAPYAVNLDKHSSNTFRSLPGCLSMHLELMELFERASPNFIPGPGMPSSICLLTYDDVLDLIASRFRKKKVK